jgi:hypothetical protein
MANTLYDYYTGQGKALPSVQERSVIYESSGLGAANTYTGSAQQNTQLLAALSKPQAPVAKVGTGVMAADALIDQQNAIKLPEPPVDTTNYPGIVASGSALTATPTDTPTDPSKPPAWMQVYLDNAPEPVNPMESYNALVTSTGLEEKQKLVGDLTAQLNSITAETQADSLKMESEGLNLAGATARNITAERNAAIRSLPIQAQLSAAQGNLALAQDKVNTLFGIKSKYETDLFNYKQNLIDKVFDYATDQEKERLQDKRDQQTRDYNTMTNNLNQAQSWASTAITNGQGALAGQIMALDPKDKDYQTKLAVLAGQIKPKVAATKSGGGSGGGGNTTSSQSSTTLQRILAGVGSVTDLTPSQQQEVQDEAYSMGLYSSNTPQWFKEQVETELQQSLTSEAMQKLWDEYRGPVTSEKSSSGSSSSGNPLDFDNL